MSLGDILQNEADPSLSLYLPTSVRGPTAQHNKAELKALIRRGQELLPDDRHGLLARAERNLEDPETWSGLDEGMALFIAPETSERLVLPYDPGRHVIVQRGYYLRPLAPLLTPGGRFYALAIDPLAPRFYLGDRRRLEEVEDAELGETLREIAGRTELPADVGFHPTGPAATTGGTATAKYHSLGESPPDYKQTELDLFVQRLAKAVDRHLANASLPLVLISDPNLLGAYRRHSGYGGLCAEAVTKNPSHLSPEELHELARGVAESTFAETRKETLDRFEMLSGRGDERAAEHLKEILPATHQGRVESLLVARDGPAWGRLSEDGSIAERHEQQTANSVDLVDRAIAATLRNGGEVFALETPAEPGDDGVRAILRY